MAEVLTFVPSGEPLAVFCRGGGSKAVGCLVYILITPFIALFAALVPALLLVPICQHFGMSEDGAKAIFPLLLIPSFLGTVAYAIREYRGRASTEVVVHRDGLICEVGGSRRVVSFAEVSAVRLSPAGIDLACILKPKAGRSLRLPPDVAPYSVVSRALEATVIRTLARRVDEQINAGSSVEVVESTARSTLIIGRSVLMMALGLLLIATLRHARLGIALARRACQLALMGMTGLEGGFAIDSTAVRSLRGSKRDLIPRNQIKLISADLDGIVWRTNDGQRIIASPFADRYWPMVAWLDTHIQKQMSSSK